MYEHFIGGADKEVLEEVADVLEGLNYEPGSIEAVSRDGGEGDGEWELTVYGSVQRAFSLKGRDDIYEVCDRYGVHYAGGGSAFG
jgi:hypothetical protein